MTERASGPVPLFDAVRASAVLLVLFAHLAEILTWQAGISWHPYDRQLGRLGVLLFFVHTSFVLMQSLARMEYGSRWAQAGTFYRRRAFRIYPLAIATVLLVWLARVPPHAVVPYEPVSAGTLVSNLLLIQDVTNVPSILIPLWSLPIEVLMYVTLPVLFWTVARSPIRVLAVWLVAAVFWLAVGSLGTRLWEFVPCFLSGILAYSLWGRLPRLLPFPAFVFAVTVGVVGYIGAAYLVQAGTHVVPFQWLLCGLVGVLLPVTKDPVWGTATHAWIAKYSYGIYLAHLPVFWLVFVVWTAPIWLQIVMGLGLTGGLAVLAYHGLEAPLIRVGQRPLRLAASWPAVVSQRQPSQP
jgi:peptidoglycan/LPS O-acetylase OafA/YrhL